jgi:putative heme-binding domain-containing protein
VADVCLAVPSAAAAGFLADTLTQAGTRENPSPDQVRHIARFGETASLDRLIANLASHQEPDPGPSLALFQAMQQGLAQRGMAPGRTLQDWAYQLAGRLLSHTPAEPSWQKTAAEMTAQHQLTQLEPRLATILNDPGADPASQAACLTALLSLKPEGYLQKAAEALNQTSLDIERRTGIGRSLASLNTAGSRLILTECMRQAPGRLALNLAALLCGTGEGADALLQAVMAGHAPASLLTQRSVRDKLLAVRPRAADEIARLTANLSPNAGHLQKIAQERQATFPAAQASAETGGKLFQIHCAVCHNIAGQGGRVGPELDGIGHRGLERLCEDVLDPNRNVDRVFRYSLVNLKNGSTLAGLYRREEGAVLIFTDAAGKDLAVNKDDVASRTESESSLMPEVFADLLTPADFHHLMAFLLSQTSPR